MLKNKQKLLPTLRQDLKLLEAMPSETGEKNWLIFDPLQDKYFNISYDAFKLLNHWQNNQDVDKFLDFLQKNDYEIDENSLDIFIEFLRKNSLLQASNSQDVKQLYEEYKKTKVSPFKWLLKNYLFIKIPLFKSDKFLERNLSKVSFFYSSFYKNLVLFLGFIGILFALRNYEEFMNTFSYLFSMEGMIYYILSIIFVKILHELGHAFTAKRNAVRVPTMGVAFLVLFPVMYTDTTDSWKLKSKYKRLQIVLAGVKTELYLALIATFLWAFLPDGILKTIAFIIATTSWITSILINISPFLRFDGYYALSDATNTKNLQPRSFAMARWFLRKYILGLNINPPEFLPLYKQRFFIIYAIATWIYRFFLFLGIALLVYFFAFKVLGIILFIVEIVWFILMPIYNELKIWFKKFNEVSLNMRNITSLILFVLFLGFLIYPWNTKVSMPAVLEAKQFNQLYAKDEAFIQEIFIKEQKQVKQGEVLAVLSSPKKSFELKQVDKKIKLLNLKLNSMAGAKKLLENRLVLEEQLLKLEKQKESLKKDIKNLQIKAPFDGIVSLNENLEKSTWVNKKQPLFTIYNPNSFEVIAYCKEEDYSYIKQSKEAKLLLDNALEKIDTSILSISTFSLPNIEFKELSSLYEGSIASSKNESENIVSQKAYYKVFAKVKNLEKNFSYRQRGVLVVESKPQSILEKAYIKVLATLIKESDF
ncbi:site-2 protease family protein [Arcobacter roscoffensis]|uniref:HlyD family efflux transporter periplasmic adaptor subunit n=1 Tax=Arcobacter roscoffensis TaxID=2961520 RepID=A0ABY5E6Q6_9BACT|nr:site-2 protease family protein [Arcobacter roscoffensis]UTJ06708.1 HlyD family efflux transporter periplasmic adaptor subunit [Arcobacter roscoffensis]